MSDLEASLHFYGKRENPIPSQYVYLARNEQGNVSDIISCSFKSKEHYRPVCNHKFNNNGLNYSLSYNQENFLSQWKEQRARAIEFIESFYVQQPDTKQSGEQ